MKLIDKLKNALFEEEYVEIEEKPKRKEIKKEKLKKKEKPKKEPIITEVKEEKPIAKKIVQPKEEKEEIKEEPKVNEHEHLGESLAYQEEKQEFKFPMVSDNEFVVDDYVKEEIKEEPEKRVNENIYKPIREEEHKPYGLEDYGIPEPEYGTYEKKEERGYFKPSPIISPIYGILDKNYKKDEIKEKREVRLTSSYAREKIDVDDVRNKAFGVKREVIPIEEEDNEEDNIVEEDNNFLDLSSEEDTPEVKTVTVGDAEEYFEDLGLEYNVDYKDKSKERATGRRTDIVKEEAPEIEENEVETEETPSEEDGDNLFDLIDSMYDKD